ncbi:diphthine--ammonia ligase [Vairimorpha necatrix]|uniref:Diphthine--ammonia ligase n=1 Tax=Vairimorpha necatrix TaxID=6039 RepID=A0AAX4JE14_9MICR
MKFVALVSGGKDSIYTIQTLKDQGHVPVGLLYMKNEDTYVDSYMYQTVGSEIVELFETCLNLPLFQYKTKCKTNNKDLDYKISKDDEVEDLYEALLDIKSKLNFEAVSSGAILSTYQKNRVLNVTKRLNLESLSPLWQRNQRDLLEEMIDRGVKGTIVKVASSFLDRSWLGKDISQIFKENVKLYDNYCGEGGEYETVVLDCKLFSHKINYKEVEIMCHPDETFANGTVFYMKIKELSLEKK